MFCFFTTKKTRLFTRKDAKSLSLILEITNHTYCQSERSRRPCEKHHNQNRQSLQSYLRGLRLRSD